MCLLIAKMLVLLVPFPAIFALESALAKPAIELPNICMPGHMKFQLKFARECLVTYVTFQSSSDGLFVVS